MISVTCDSCGTTIDTDTQAWFGADFTEAPEPIEDGDIPLLSLPAEQHEFHFDRPECLAEWAFARTLESAK